MRRTVLFYTMSVLLVSVIVTVAVLGAHPSHLKRDEGPQLFPLWSTHGVHLFDLVVLAVEILLLTLLTITLLDRFSRAR